MGTITYELLVGSFPGISDDLTNFWEGSIKLLFFYLRGGGGGHYLRIIFLYVHRMEWFYKHDLFHIRITNSNCHKLLSLT